MNQTKITFLLGNFLHFVPYFYLRKSGFKVNRYFISREWRNRAMVIFYFLILLCQKTLMHTSKTVIEKNKFIYKKGPNCFQKVTVNQVFGKRNVQNFDRILRFFLFESGLTKVFIYRTFLLILCLLIFNALQCAFFAFQEPTKLPPFLPSTYPRTHEYGMMLHF